MPKPDAAHLQTDKELAKLEKRIAKIYKEAADDLQKTIDDYFAKFVKRDAKQKARLEAGEITEQEYKQWRLAQMGRGERFKALQSRVAERYTEANETAVRYVNDATPGIYSLNRNYSAYTIEKAAGNVGFDLWDEQTVKRLIVDNPEVMPYYPPEKALNCGIDLAYGKRQISASVTSSILQGKSITGIAKDLQTRIPDMNKASAIRTARTAVTGAQNAGRMDSYVTAEKMGIKVRKEWLATIDGRTRHSHAMLDGEVVDKDKKFGNGCMFPGDPNGPPWEVYNCRCTLIAAVDGVDTSDAQRRARDQETGNSVLIENMSYAEWAGWKKAEGAGAQNFKKAQVQKAMDENQVEEPKQQKPIEYQNPTSEDYSNLGKASRKNVSKEDQEQIFKHDGGGYVATHNYSTINSNLRKDGYTGNKLTDDDKKTISALDRAISRTQTDKDYVFTRYVNADYLTNKFCVYQTGFHGEQVTISNMILDFGNSKKQVPRITQELQKLIGTDDIDSAFLSTSMLPDKNIMKSKSVLIKIKAPKGTDVYVPKNRKESECIFARGVKRTIESVEFDEQQNKWIITEVISNG